MGLTEKISLCLIALFLLAALIRLFAAPLRLALRVLLNTLLGFGALFLLNVLAPFTGVALGFNVWNALTVGVLGVPGFALLLLLRFIFV